MKTSMQPWVAVNNSAKAGNFYRKALERKKRIAGIAGWRFSIKAFY